MIRVLIADDHKLVRDSLEALLMRDKDIQVVGQARDGQEAIELVDKFSPDVVSMDVKMPRVNGFEAAREIGRQSGGQNRTQVLIVAMSWDEQMIQQAVNGGAKGYVTKTDIFAELIPAVRAVHKGQSYFSKTIREFLPPATRTE